MASSTTTPYSLLTTIFTPPSGCFVDSPGVWTDCSTWDALNMPTFCYWSLPTSCYPPGPKVVSTPLNSFSSFGQVYQYAPGVLPYGYVSLGTPADGGAFTAVFGCPSGWSTWLFWCSSTTHGSWQFPNASQSHSATTGSFVAFLPQINVLWASSNLSIFTPASAPILPPASISRFEATATSPSTSTSQSRKQNSSPTSNANAATTGTLHQTSASTNGLSTAAQAGIGVGVAIVALFLLSVVVFFVFRRRQRRKNRALQRAGSTRPYLDSKAELPHNEVARRPQEVEAHVPLTAEVEARGPITTEASPPPIPISSKPRFDRGIGRHELPGDFQGHEIGH